MNAASGEKRLWLIVTFPSTTEAILMEQTCRMQELPSRLIPVPRSISASCGMAWRAPTDSRSSLEQAIAAAGIAAEGWFYIML